ncbi:MAG: MFS transporter [Clostridia bacterium]|nr:MFS transporter [Clostridia bacterium]
MSAKPNYNRTLAACYLGYITQAITSTFAPMLFLTFRSSYGISLEVITLIPSMFFLVQLLTDLAAAKFADRIGYRTCVIIGEISAAIGLVGLGVFPEIFPHPFAGLMVAVTFYAIGSGIMETLVSPIVEACPFDNKEGVMSILHSFYCWGCAAVILGSTVFFSIFGIENWKYLSCLWAIVPLANIINFATCPIEYLVEDGKGMTITQLFKSKVFWVLALLMVCAGASEHGMAQWASAFTESALNVSKTVGDLAGPFLFAILMGLARTFHGKFSEKFDLTNFMVGSSILCIACYLLAALTSNPILGLIGCAVCGTSVGIMWPGAFSIAAQKCPTGGTALFALLALTGDLGCSVGPGVVGVFSSLANDNLKAGLLAATIFPAVMIVGLLYMKKHFANIKKG